MGQKKYPVHTKGDRNVLCPYYSNCLDHAVKFGWEYWACMDCQHKRNQNIVVSLLLSSTGNDPYHSVSPEYYKEE